MPDLEVLKKRVENAEKHLKAVQSARENECTALLELWAQIRDRFAQQDQEIAEYRARVAELGDINAELTQLVDVMIKTIEKSVTRTNDDTVPKIAELARELLVSEPKVNGLHARAMSSDSTAQDVQWAARIRPKSMSADPARHLRRSN